MLTMAHYQIQDLSFAYAQGQKNVLRDICLQIQEGDFFLVCGPTGSGKTTLLRLLKPEAQPAGEQSGSILYDGSLLEELDSRKGAEDIAMVFQSPDDQIVMDTVWQELAFAMENLGYPPGTIQRRMGEVVNYFGIESYLHKAVYQLSGGQKQLLNLASVMMLRPRVLLLDEPTAQLDPVAAREFLHTVHRVNQELSTTVVISEHRLEDLFPLATRVLMLNQGKTAYQGPPRKVIRQVWSRQDDCFGHYLPAVSRLCLSLNGSCVNEESLPLTVRETRQWAAEKELKNKVSTPGGERERKKDPVPGKSASTLELLSCHGLYFQYGRDLPLVLKNLSLGLEKGDFFAVLGGNGSGKTTLLKAISGILKPQKGSIFWQGQKLKNSGTREMSSPIGYLAQNPALYFSCDTVQGQLAKRAEELGLEVKGGRMEHTIDLFGLGEVLHKHPYDISGGQQQKVALALVLFSGPELLLLDEPTKGLDPLWKLQLAEMLSTLLKRGSTILMVSHDIEFTARYADKCALLFDGQLVAPDHPRSFFSGNYFYTTVIQRALGDRLPGVIRLEDVNLC